MAADTMCIVGKGSWKILILSAKQKALPIILTPMLFIKVIGIGMENVSRYVLGILHIGVSK